MKNDGFTLIEMMVVVVILGMVAAVVVTNLGGRTSDAAVRLTKVDLARLKAQVELFKADHRRYPERLEDLVVRPAWIDAKDWHEYREEPPLDGWKRPYAYRVPGTRGRFDIVSWGEDGREGGEGVDADLWSHALKP